MLKNAREKWRAIKGNSLLSSSVGLLLITLSVKALGYGEKLALAYYWGTSYQVDVYTLVITVILSIFILFREIIEPGYLNVFLELKVGGKERIAWSLFKVMGMAIILISILLCVVLIGLDISTVRFFAPGFSDRQLSLATELFKIAFPATTLLNLSTLTGITLNGLKQFVIPATGELVFKALIIVCLIMMFETHGILGIGIGVLIGAFAKLLVHIKLLWKAIDFGSTSIEKKSLVKMWWLTWPLLIGVVFSQLSGLIDNMFASRLEEGAISSLSYAKKLIDLPVLMFPYIISVVVFPYFSQLSKERDYKRQLNLLRVALSWIVIFFLPLSAFFACFSEELVQLVFERGAFDSNSTWMTSSPLMIYSFGLPFFAIETILVIFFYSNEDTKTPIFIGIACVILNIILTYLLVDVLGHKAIAWAYVIQKTIKNLVLLYLLNKSLNISLSEPLVFMAKLLGATTLTASIMMAYRNLDVQWFDEQGFLGQALNISVVFVLAAIGYIFCLKLLRVRFSELTLK